MAINLEPLMLHMAWANQEIFKEIASLPDVALKAYVTNEEWQVCVILLHIVKAANSYGCRLNGAKFATLDSLESMHDVKKYTEMLKEFDAELLNLSKQPDRIIEVNREGKITHWQASTILSQAIHHATEHRAQAVAALEFRGFKAPNLDDYDLWAYERSTK
jgi:uncharacterized damage-inducible protein DinB